MSKAKLSESQINALQSCLWRGRNGVVGAWVEPRTVKGLVKRGFVARGDAFGRYEITDAGREVLTATIESKRQARVATTNAAWVNLPPVPEPARDPMQAPVQLRIEISSCADCPFGIRVSNDRSACSVPNSRVGFVSVSVPSPANCPLRQGGIDLRLREE